MHNPTLVGVVDTRRNIVSWAELEPRALCEQGLVLLRLAGSWCVSQTPSRQAGITETYWSQRRSNVQAGEGDGLADGCPPAIANPVLPVAGNVIHRCDPDNRKQYFVSYLSPLAPSHAVTNL